LGDTHKNWWRKNTKIWVKCQRTSWQLDSAYLRNETRYPAKPKMGGRGVPLSLYGAVADVDPAWQTMEIMENRRFKQAGGMGKCRMINPFHTDAAPNHPQVSAGRRTMHVMVVGVAPEWDVMVSANIPVVVGASTSSISMPARSRLLTIPEVTDWWSNTCKNWKSPGNCCLPVCATAVVIATK